MINSVAISKLCADNQEEEESSRILTELEHIDDECDQKGIIFVRIDDSLEAQEYGIEEPPALVYFEKGVPSLYEGSHFVRVEDDKKFETRFSHQVTCRKKKTFSLGSPIKSAVRRLKMSRMRCWTNSSIKGIIWLSCSVIILRRYTFFTSHH